MIGETGFKNSWGYWCLTIAVILIAPQFSGCDDGAQPTAPSSSTGKITGATAAAKAVDTAPPPTPSPTPDLNLAPAGLSSQTEEALKEFAALADKDGNIILTISAYDSCDDTSKRRTALIDNAAYKLAKLLKNHVLIQTPDSIQNPFLSSLHGEFRQALQSVAPYNNLKLKVVSASNSLIGINKLSVFFDGNLGFPDFIYLDHPASKSTGTLTPHWMTSLKGYRPLITYGTPRTYLENEYWVTGFYHRNAGITEANRSHFSVFQKLTAANGLQVPQALVNYETVFRTVNLMSGDFVLTPLTIAMANVIADDYEKRGDLANSPIKVQSGQYAVFYPKAQAPFHLVNIATGVVSPVTPSAWKSALTNFSGKQGNLAKEDGIFGNASTRTSPLSEYNCEIVKP